MRFLASLPVLIALCAPAWTQSKPPDAQQLLDTALQSSDLFHGTHSPFVLDADFTAQLNVPIQGNLQIRWGSNDHWRLEIKLGPFAMVKTRNGEQTHILRNVAFTPARVEDLFTLLRLNQRALRLTAQGMKNRHENGQSFNCIKYGDSLQACTDASTGDLVSIESPAAEGKNRADYSDFVDFEGLRIPRHLRLLNRGGNVVSVQVTRLASEPFDDKLLVLPKEAIARRECDGEKPPRVTKMGEIKLPAGVSSSTVSTTVTVLEDGSIADVQVTSAASKAINDAVVKAIRTSTFKPAMCGSDPVTSDFDITITSTVQRY